MAEQQPTWQEQSLALVQAVSYARNQEQLDAANAAIQAAVGENNAVLNLQDASLRGADMHDANLQGADLRGADMQDVDLQGADLRGAKLESITFNRYTLEYTDPDGVNTRKLVEANLEFVKNNEELANFARNMLKINVKALPTQETAQPAPPAQVSPEALRQRETLATELANTITSATHNTNEQDALLTRVGELIQERRSATKGGQGR